MVLCLSGAMPFWDRRLELVFLSHSDKDHVGALGGVASRYNIGKIIDAPRHGDLLRYGLLSFDIVKGSEPVVSKVDAGGSESNERSVAIKIVYEKFSALFTGDLDLGSELALVGKGVLTKAEVLKVSHHGSKFGSGEEFLRRIMPKWSVVSVGAKNSYGHPSSDTLLRLDTVGSKVLRTDQMGSIRFVTDGKSIAVFKAR